ncbi:protoglobin family protein [Aspergillus clavatus NRRL 1]|uniref:Globin-sensor domain-containing protein n=1 Tax=Aspergillus clavatus (strain ATCC 1007 / CBS 513.65 / DSM 816 / NCTC 3887 / NRRL 1 / QM 1276 / 107) TaxID=344612 RepID=A1C4D9_ASPCL|nr:uncharacterized protein ACLA_059450 [Aspergillus clavatus NRRL 1]EAW15279.1 conserved hypothetical protein [Aspergillus clavatus NRRL 1]
MPFSDHIPNIQHARRKDLYTSFPKRMAYIQAFINFTRDDITTFNKGARYLKAAIPGLTHRLYEKMLEFDITARALRTRSTSSEVQVDDYFTIDSPHVQRRKIFWKWYLTRFFSDPSQIEYWQYLEKVGTMHTGKILLHPLTIEYIHMNACLGYLKELLLETIFLHEEMTVAFKFALVRSLSKILCIQNDLIARCHIRDGEEYLEEFSNGEEIPKPEPAVSEREEVASAVSDQKSVSHLSIRSSNNSRPASADDTPASPMSFGRVSSTTTTTASSDTASISSSSRVPLKNPGVIPVFVSPFKAEHSQTYETKIWSSGKGGKSKGLGYRTQ